MSSISKHYNPTLSALIQQVLPIQMVSQLSDIKSGWDKTETWKADEKGDNPKTPLVSWWPPHVTVVYNYLVTSGFWLAMKVPMRATTNGKLPNDSHLKIQGDVNAGVLNVQYIPRNMHTVFALLCFVVVIHWLIFPYPSGLLHWHYGNLTIAPVPAKQPWWIWINTSCEFIMNDCITTTKQSTTKPCAYFLGYTVWCTSLDQTTTTISMG